MDTVGHNAPRGDVSDQAAAIEKTQEKAAHDQRSEALERMRYVALQGRCGLLTGPRGAGKTWLTQQLVDELRRQGTPAETINLTALPGEELAFSVASKLGFGIDVFDTEMSIWALLQDYAESIRDIGTRHVLVFDDIDRADDGALPRLNRVMNLFESTGACIFTATPKVRRPIRRLLKSAAELKIELGDLSAAETSQILAQRLQRLRIPVTVTDDAVQALQKLGKGQLDRVKRLAELSSLAVEVEQSHAIDGRLVHEVAGELRY